jgi:predicted transposase/invertase (TIGR01784 family)
MTGKYTEGIAVGEARGIEKGIKKGIKKGMEKGIERIAINMLKDNEPLDKISRFTGLSQDEIAKIKNRVE